MKKYVLKNWVVENDGSERFKNVVLKYINDDIEEMFVKLNGMSFNKLNGKSFGYYYGIDDNCKPMCHNNIPFNCECLTIDEFEKRIYQINIYKDSFVKHNKESLKIACVSREITHNVVDENNVEYIISSIKNDGVLIYRNVSYDELLENFTMNGNPCGIIKEFDLTFNDICQDLYSKYFSEFLNEEIHWTGKNILMNENLESVKISMDFINSKFRKI